MPPDSRTLGWGGGSGEWGVEQHELDFGAFDGTSLLSYHHLILRTSAMIVLNRFKFPSFVLALATRVVERSWARLLS